MSLNKAFTIFAILSLLILSTFLIINNNYPLRVNVASLLAIPNNDFIVANNIKQINLKLSNKDNLHFNNLYQFFNYNKYTNEFSKYYSENNKWRKSTITVDGKKFKVKIKSHGKNPRGHKFGEHFSIDLKFKSKKHPFFSNRTNLVIYNRLQLQPEILNLFASKFNLPNPKFELVNVTMEDKNQYFYFIEERINKKFFEVRNLPWIIFNKNNKGSLIYDGTNSNVQLSAMLSKQLDKKNSYNDSLKSLIKNDYLNFNKAIADKNYNKLQAFFNLDYMAKITAFNILYNADAHGYTGPNLEMAYDTITHLFYPIVHRDVNRAINTDCKNQIDIINKNQSLTLFWDIMLSDSTFKQATFNQVETFLINNKKETLIKEINKIHTNYKASHIFEFSYLNSIYDGYSIIKNIECIRE